MKSASIVIREQVQNFYLIRRLSLYELKSANNSNYLGMSWEVINPVIQILIYWFVFGYGIREREAIQLNSGQEVSFLPWMVTGFILWTFFYQVTIKGSKSIYTRLKMLSRMNFPMSVIPNIVVFSQLYIHLAMIIVVIGILLLFDIFPSIYMIQVVYFLIATMCFSYSVALVTSTLSTIIRDVHMLLNASLRMLLYLSPILWHVSGSNIDGWIQTIMRLNPLYYLIEGYRSGFLSEGWYMIEHPLYSLYFWGLTLIIFMIGASIHVKFRRHFIDFL